MYKWMIVNNRYVWKLGTHGLDQGPKLLPNQLVELGGRLEPLGVELHVALAVPRA